MFAFTSSIRANQIRANKNNAPRKIDQAVSMALENLESRQLLSVASDLTARAARALRHVHADRSVTVQTQAKAAALNLTTSQVAVYDGTQLVINGTTGNDSIKVTQKGSTYTLYNGTVSTSITGSFSSLLIKGDGGNDSITLDPSVTTAAIIYGGVGNDTITAGSGTDTIYSGTGINYIKCGTGTDTVVTLNSAGDRITAGTGADSFWMDNKSSETVIGETAAQIAQGAVHRIGSFANFTSDSGKVTTISTTLNGPTLPEPAVPDAGVVYSNFSSDPLFGDTGPGPNDIEQGYVGDCYFLSTLSSIAKVDANRIRNSIVALGDGTYAVQFFNGNTPVYERVDANLPTWGANGPLAYAGTGTQNCLWVALMEKAFAQFRTGQADYNNINAGWMDEVYSDFHANPTDIWAASSASSLFSQIQSLLASGKSVTMAINNPEDGALLIADHAYSVDHVSVDASGNQTITLRNPWGIVGVGNGPGNGGYVTITAQQAFDSFSGVIAAAV